MLLRAGKLVWGCLLSSRSVAKRSSKRSVAPFSSSRCASRSFCRRVLFVVVVRLLKESIRDIQLGGLFQSLSELINYPQNKGKRI